jgi:5-methylcytosine-specific restriction endonuclease McrA
MYRTTERKYGSPKARAHARQIVYARESLCYICGEPVDKNLPAGHPMAPQLEDVMPVSKGGKPTDPANLRLAHAACNNRKSNLPAYAAIAAVRGLTNSRKW